MAYAQEMKNLVADIKLSHKDRAERIGEIKRETRDILKAADNYMKEVSAELKEMASDLKDFLANSEEARKKDFNAMMGEIRARIKKIQKDVRDFLAKGEEARMADFNTTMKDIENRIKEIKNEVRGIKRETKERLDNYSSERKEAARYWASLSKKRVAGSKEEGRQEEGRLSYREFVKEYLTKHKGVGLEEAAKAWGEYKED